MIQRIRPVVNLPESGDVLALLDVELILLVIQSMCLLATEANCKITAADVAARVAQEYKTKITPQKAGEIISSLKITYHIAHGKHIYLFGSRTKTIICIYTYLFVLYAYYDKYSFLFLFLFSFIS